LLNLIIWNNNQYPVDVLDHHMKVSGSFCKTIECLGLAIRIIAGSSNNQYNVYSIDYQNIYLNLAD